MIQKRPLLIVIAVLCFAIIAVDAYVPVFFLRNHYSKHFSTVTTFRYRLTGDYVERTNSIYFEAEVESCFEQGRWHDVCGKVRLYLPKSDSLHLHYGDVIESSADMYAINNFTGQSFDYQKYMKHKRIYHNVFLKANNYIKIASKRYNPILYAARQINKTFRNRLFRSGLGKQEAGLALGMLLSNKQFIDADIKRSFNTSGLGHILCVSGLHVGLIIGLFDRLLRRISQNIFYYFGCKLFCVLLAFFIALIVGFTPAVLRAATMFSILIIDSYIGRNHDKLNLLAFIAFVFLLCDPLVLFDVGFQLSFLAVAGIYTFVPLFNNMFSSNVRSYGWHKILGMVRENAQISLSAQMFALPVVAWHFKRLPAYFLLANLVVLPFVTLLLGMLILLLVVVDVPFLGDIVVFATDMMLKGLIFFTFWIDGLPFSVIE